MCVLLRVCVCARAPREEKGRWWSEAEIIVKTEQLRQNDMEHFLFAHGVFWTLSSIFPIKSTFIIWTIYQVPLYYHVCMFVYACNKKKKSFYVCIWLVLTQSHSNLLYLHLRRQVVCWRAAILAFVSDSLPLPRSFCFCQHLFIYLFVCLETGQPKNGPTDFDESLIRGVSSLGLQTIRFSNG